MFKNYLVVALRNLYRNKLYTFVNLVGLGVAMALCVTAYVNYRFGADFDSFHEKADRIYSVNSFSLDDGRRTDWSIVPEPMGPAIASDITGIRRFSRVAYSSGIMRHREAVFNEAFFYVDDDFFEMFSFEIAAGSTHPFREHQGVVISQETADKYFGDADPIGERVILSPDGEREYDFVVHAVMTDPPRNSSMKPNVLVPYQRSAEIRERDISDWYFWSRAVFIELEPGVTAASVESQLDGYLPRTNEANSQMDWNGFFLIPLPELAAHSRDLYYSPFFSGMHPAAVYGPAVTALLVLLLACFNFVNTSIAFASRRLREIGIRKVIGGRRVQLVKQFMGENLILCLMALLAAAALSEIFVPAYSSLWPDLDLTISYADNPGLVGFLMSLLLFTGLAAGAYPAFYVSRFQPIAILKGRQMLSGNQTLTRILLTLQFALAMTTIIAAVYYSQNAEFIKTLDLGFDRDHVCIVRIRGEDEYRLLKNSVASHPDILSVGGSQSVMGRYWYGTTVVYDGDEKRVDMFTVGEDQFETFGFTLVEGRTFDAQRAGDVEEAVIVNEKLVREYGWSSALDKYLTFETSDSTTELCRVIGVVRDFFPGGVNSTIDPTVLRMIPPEDYRYVSILAAPGATGSVTDFVRDTYTRLLPDRPYDSFWLDETMAEEIQVNNSIRLVFLYIAGMVVIISAMGLFALVSLKIARRTKELGIRKVLGATLVNISYLISRELLLIVGIGCVLASVLGYFLVNALSASIWTYYVGFGLTPFAVAGLVVLAVTVLTVCYQVYRLSATNPVEALRDE